MIAHNHINAQWSSTGLQHINRLGWQALLTKKAFALFF